MEILLDNYKAVAFKCIKNKFPPMSIITPEEICFQFTDNLLK